MDFGTTVTVKSNIVDFFKKLFWIYYYYYIFLNHLILNGSIFMFFFSCRKIHAKMLLLSNTQMYKFCSLKEKTLQSFILWVQNSSLSCVPSPKKMLALGMKLNLTHISFSPTTSCKWCNISENVSEYIRLRTMIEPSSAWSLLCYWIYYWK